MSSVDVLDMMMGAAAKKTSAKKGSAKKGSSKKASSSKALSSGKVSGSATGTVVSYNPARGFGFIKDDSKDVDYFFHKSQLVVSGIDSVKPGDKLSFEVQGAGGDCKKGNCAINIKLMKGGRGQRGGNIQQMLAMNGMQNNNMEAELFQRLMGLSSNQLNSFANMANLNNRFEGQMPGLMQGGGKDKKLSKLALVNLLLA